MAETLVRPGEIAGVVVTPATPFGLLVQTHTGVPGLVRGAGADVGAMVRVRVLDYDTVESRLSGTR